MRYTSFKTCYYQALLAGLLGLSFPAYADFDVNQAFNHINAQMDLYHATFDIYTDANAGGNHGEPSLWFPSSAVNDISYDGEYKLECYAGPTCIRFEFTKDNASFGGIWWTPQGAPNGFDLEGTAKLVLYAKSNLHNTNVKFLIGNILGRGSMNQELSTEFITLGTIWQRVEIVIPDSENMSEVHGIFGLVMDQAGVVFIDQVQYLYGADNPRLDEPRFVLSFPYPEVLPVFSDLDPETGQPHPQAGQVNWGASLHNTAYVYDNALILLAYLARGLTLGNEDDMRRAKLIADAFLLAQANDRTYNDNRIRNAYQPGDIVINWQGQDVARLPGWWDNEDQAWYEDEFNAGTHTGNISWVQLALAVYHKVTVGLGGTSPYLTASIDMANWIYNETRAELNPEINLFGGYTGGWLGWDNAQTRVGWRSTEHNIDVWVGFYLLYQITNDSIWRNRALQAKHFVDNMYSPLSPNGFISPFSMPHMLTGTLDGEQSDVINGHAFVTDTNTWGVLSTYDYFDTLNWVEHNTIKTSAGITCTDFNTDKDGGWFEGCGQYVLARKLAAEFDPDNSATHTKLSNMYLNEIGKAQIPGGGVYAATVDGVSTGFDWEYFRRVHTGAATTWPIFAALGFNPYWGERVENPKPYPDNIGRIIDPPSE